MNENINLIEILKDCPKGTKLYSPLVGEVELDRVYKGHEYPISTLYGGAKDLFLNFTKEGLFLVGAPNGECILFPSKDQRDWSKFQPKKSKFDPKTLQPFDRVLVRHSDKNPWRCNTFSHFSRFNYLVCSDGVYTYGIPYNEETKHLVGTTEEAPEFYRYWEE